MLKLANQLKSGYVIVKSDDIGFKLSACSGMGEYLAENAFTMTWIDPDDITLNGATLAEWNQTVLVRKVGSYPSDHTDGTVLATTSRALGNKNAYRSTGYKDSNRETGTTYYYKLFSQSTAGVWNNLTGNQFAENIDMSWGMVQGFVRAGRGPDLFPVGTVFYVDHPEYTHQDSTGLWFRVAGHDQVPAADESLTHTMCLEMVDCLLAAPYDVAELEYALTEDTTAQAGKTYYTLSGSTYTALTEGTDYDIGDSVPMASWYEKNLSGRSTHGSNNPKQSNYINWLNSSGSAGSSIQPMTIWDQCGSTLLNKNGFLKYIDPLFLAAVQPAKLTTAICNAEGGGSITHTAKFWPLSRTQVLGLANNGIMENTQFDYYKNGGSKVKYLKDTSEARVWMLRSPDTTRADYVHLVQASGESQSSGYYANVPSFCISPACIIA